MQDALLPLMKALISNKLLKHSEEDVKVTVTYCVTEITRITAPDAPYDDEKMKVTFRELNYLQYLNPHKNIFML